jgi:CRP/FNR family transcriptional regulator, cyclic AMP receptor protein
MSTFGAPSILALLSEKERTHLAALGKRRTYRDQEVIHERGDAGACLSIVIDGSVSLYRIMSDGSIVFASSVNPGQNYADAATVAGTARTHRAIARGGAVVDHYDPVAFQEILNHHPSIIRALYQVSSYRLNITIEMLDDARILPTRVRLAKMILRLERASSKPGSVPGKQEELAQILGLSTVSVIQNLKLLAAEGLIQTGYREIRVPAVDRLKRWVEVRDWE